jgi:L-ascorbate metabolism protein UlaG (beta-lactamase superfamily)
MLSITTGDERPFVMSTPRLEWPDALHLHWSFDDPKVDRLFRLKTVPAPWRVIKRDLELADDDERRILRFLTPHAPEPYEPYDGSGVRWRYFGHACILVETKDFNILLDPVLSYTYESSVSRYTYADLPERIDWVLVTHNHQDHVLLETLLQIRHKVGEIVVPRGGAGALQDPSLMLTLRNIGFDRVRELGELETIRCGGAAVTGLPFLGEHCDLAVSTKLAYLVSLGREQLLFAADSCNVEPRLYDHIYARIGSVGTLFIGMECEGAPMSWLYGPLFSDQVDRDVDRSRRLNGSDYDKAIAIVERLRSREVYVYAMGQEPWLNHVMSIKYTDESRPIVESNRLVRECEARGFVAERLFGEKEILIDQIEALC